MMHRAPHELLHRPPAGRSRHTPPAQRVDSEQRVEQQIITIGWQQRAVKLEEVFNVGMPGEQDRSWGD